MAYTWYSVTNSILNEMGEVQFSSVSDFDNATGLHQYIKDKVNDVIFEIYNEEDNEWDFAKTLFTQVLTIGDRDYDVDSQAAWVDWDSFYIDRDAALDKPDAEKLHRMPWSTYRDYYLADDLNDTTTDEYNKPTHIVKPENGRYFIVTPKPDAAYTVKYWGTSKPSLMTASTDVPDIPEQHKAALIERVLMYAYRYEDNFENAQIAQGTSENKINQMRRMRIHQPVTMRADV